MSKLTDSKAWKDLAAHHGAMKAVHTNQTEKAKQVHEIQA